MSFDEMIAFTEKLQKEREALRDEAVKQNRQRVNRDSVRTRAKTLGASETKERKPRAKSEAQAINAEMLKFLMSED